MQNQAFFYILEVTDKPVDWAYEAWDEVVENLSHKDNHNRAIAAQVLCNLAKSDPENRMLQDFNQGLRNLYDAVENERVRAKALELIESEEDTKYRKKYASVWRGGGESPPAPLDKGGEEAARLSDAICRRFPGGESPPAPLDKGGEEAARPCRGEKRPLA